MRTQKVGVDIWKMAFSSCEYLALAFVAYVLLKLLHACFWFPGYLQKREQYETIDTKDAEEKDNDTISDKGKENDLVEVEDKKTI